MISRIIQIREKEGLSQEKFAKKIGLSRNFINQVENGKKNFSDRTISDICEKFNINEEWLRTGKGEMYIELEENDLIKQAAILLGEKDPLFESFISTYSKLNKANRKVILDFGIEILENLPDKIKKE